jgi:hypothetical protein
MTSPFRYFKTSREIIRLAVMLYVRLARGVVAQIVTRNQDMSSLAAVGTTPTFARRHPNVGHAAKVRDRLALERVVPDQIRDSHCD